MGYLTSEEGQAMPEEFRDLDTRVVHEGQDGREFERGQGMRLAREDGDRAVPGTRQRLRWKGRVPGERGAVGLRPSRRPLRMEISCLRRERTPSSNSDGNDYVDR